MIHLASRTLNRREGCIVDVKQVMRDELTCAKFRVVVMVVQDLGRRASQEWHQALHTSCQNQQFRVSIVRICWSVEPLKIASCRVCERMLAV